MQIHTTKSGENLKAIAEQYTVDENSLQINNNIHETTPTEGEELLILIPTRTYTVQYGDTLERIGIRFGIKQGDLLAQNPILAKAPMKPGDKLTLKYADKSLGMAVSNGYYFKDCSKEALIRAMPFLTYVTFASAVVTDKGIRKTFDDRDSVKLVKMNGKIPLLRMHNDKQSCYNALNGEEYSDKLIEFAKRGEYKGIVLSACGKSNSAIDFARFIVNLRKKMIGCDLILITEIDEQSPSEFSEYSDGSILYYPKFVMENPPSFKEGEEALLSDFSCKGESAKTFIDLPSLAYLPGGCLSIDDALSLARKKKHKISQNKTTLLSHFNDEKQGECRFISLKGIKSLFELISEYDYMGICFDIMKTPLSHLMMYNALFKTSYYTYVRSREGCSRVNAD